MKILLLDDTGFIGPHILKRAISRGHEVTLFNRGRSNTNFFPDVRKLKGDRDNDLAAFYIRMAEDGRSGEFNASGLADRFSFGNMLNGIRATAKSAANFHLVTNSFLAEQGVIWQELPLWGFIEDGVTELTIENRSSIAAGLEFRPFSVQIKMPWRTTEVIKDDDFKT